MLNAAWGEGLCLHVVPAMFAGELSNEKYAEESQDAAHLERQLRKAARQREAITKQLLQGSVMRQASAEGRVEDVRLLLQEARR